MSDWIWSDLHLGHANIIEYEKRPFSGVEEQSQRLLSAWRGMVKSNDRVFNAGDVFFRTPKDEAERIIKNLPGYKILILGNHDRGHSVKWWLDVGFDEVSPYPIIVDGFWMISHEPLYVGPSMPYGNIHGHTHSTSMTNPLMYNVSVENIGYKPILLADVKRIVMDRADRVGVELGKQAV